MLKTKFFLKGQSLAEIVAFFAVASLVFVAMQKYIQRGVQGKTKHLTDVIIGTEQIPYTADWETSKSQTRFKGKTRVQTKAGGRVIRTIKETTKSSSESESYSASP